MTILVTGAAGFIGFHLTRRLAGDGVEVIGLDNINDYYSTDLKFDRLASMGIDKDSITDDVPVSSTVHSNLKFIKTDLENKPVIDELFADAKFDVVINLAAQAGVR